MSTALTSVARTLVPVAPATSQSLVEQLLAARVKIERRVESFKSEAEVRAARERREFAEQAAQLIDAAPEPLDVRLVETLGVRLKSLRDSDERSAAGLESLQRTWQAIQERIGALKHAAADRELLIKVLRQQHDKLAAERARREDEAGDLTELIERLEKELADLTAGASATAKSAERGRKA